MRKELTKTQREQLTATLDKNIAIMCEEIVRFSKNGLVVDLSDYTSAIEEEIINMLEK